MKYADLRQWFIEWQDFIPDEPQPLDYKDGVTTDCRKAVQSSIAGMDAMLARGVKITKNHPYYTVAMAYYTRLLQIKKAIEENKTNITHYREHGFAKTKNK